MITRKSCRAAGACYTDRRLARVIPVGGLTPAEFAARVDVPHVDRVWVLIYAAGLSDVDCRLFACRTARRALARVSNPDPRSVAAIDVAERFARGDATSDDLRAAHRAAYAVVADAADAVGDAAYAASYSAYAAAAYAASAAYADADAAADAADAAYAATAYTADAADAAYAASAAAAYAASAAYADAAADAADAADAARDDERRAQITDLVQVLG